MKQMTQTQAHDFSDKKYQLQMGTKLLSTLKSKSSIMQSCSTQTQTAPMFQDSNHVSQPFAMNYPYQMLMPLSLPQITIEQIQLLQALITNPYFIPIDSQTSYEQQQKLMTQLPYQSLNNTLFEDKLTKTSDSFYPNGVPHESYTTQGFYSESKILGKQNNFLKKKTVRNTIIIDEEEDAIDTSTPKSLSLMKHYSTPIKKVFQTHLSKLPIEQNPADHKFQCGHDGCELRYRTNKQKVSHHGKMDVECQKDTIAILKMIAKYKKIINHLTQRKSVRNENLESLIETYENTMKKISEKEYVQMICGLKFEDNSTIKDI